MSIILNGNTIAGIGRHTVSNANTLLTFKWSDHIINSMEWLRADTFSWQSGAVYVAAYNHLVKDVQGKEYISETIEGHTIWYRLADDGHKIVTQASDYDGSANVNYIYEDTGVAWYYILDTENQRFKLPRTKYGIVGLRDVVGKYVEAGLPDITGSISSNNWAGSASASSALYPSGSGQNSLADGWGVNTINIKASRNNPIYGKSTTVQPPATQMYLYFYVGEYSQSAIEQTAGITSEQLNQKLDLDVGNATSNTKETIVGWGMPDYDNKVEYNNAAPTTFVADEDYYVCCKGDVLSYDIYKNGSAFLVEFLYSRGYNSVWAYLPKGTEIRRRDVSQYNNFIVVPLKGL